MTSPLRIPMERRLARKTLSTICGVRTLCEADREDLAILLYAAYRGTVDFDGETFRDARAEIDRLFDGTYGRLLPGCSFLFEEGDFLASACLVTWWSPHEAPLVAFAMTQPEARRRGYARHLLQTSMNALFDRGYRRLTLIVTDGNEPAQALYQSLGFRKMQ